MDAVELVGDGGFLLSSTSTLSTISSSLSCSLECGVLSMSVNCMMNLNYESA